MTRRALLMGSETRGLHGVSRDLAAMSTWLGEEDFALDVRTGAEASRDGLLDGLEALARTAELGDAVVIYYSGHGGRVHVPADQRVVDGRIVPRALQYIVPTDHDKTRSFRGIFRAELSSYVRRITDRTPNVTVILDCCHSSDVVRRDVKAIVDPWGEGIEAHVAWMLEQGYALEQLPLLRNPAVVVLSACVATRQAYEFTRPDDGTRAGLFTHCLVEAARHGSPRPTRPTWEALMRTVVDRVQSILWYQRPQGAGPLARVLFSEQQHRRLGALTLQQADGQWFLDGGLAAGLRSGDRYHAPELGGQVEVVEVEPSRARISVPEGPPPPTGTLMVPAAAGTHHQPCRIEGTGPLARQLHDRLQHVPGLVVDPSAPAPAFALSVDGLELTVLDAAGRRLRYPWRDAPSLPDAVREERLDALLDDLHGLARAADLLKLARRASEAPCPTALPHTVEWGSVVDGDPRPLPHRGGALSVGERLYVSIDNRGVKPIHVSLLDVGVGRAITLLNPSEPEGIDLAVGATELLGAAEYGRLVGLELSWPSIVPPDGPRPESLVIFVSRAPLPVTSWETKPWSKRAKPPPSQPKRSDLLDTPLLAVHLLELSLRP